ncbi:hypothetical protein RFD13_000380 [Klebsiella aerogenes]|uniref:hypothetical protein n=1 Tax=Klebsiella aerogenes TaxID=548 RepID=UPI0012DE6A30|nr:hypothetical protein [Klebsiella aerogenes]EKZ9889223.1 hypothetical protein [Klebsiella aerogenes]EMA4693178.1 hypothetical protein [Klebsiella aerogenes]WHB04777.1 hypothetical protein HZS33_010100 [Klebsiella aerogenes]WVJ32664.1 hypothetical protein V1231_10480 [Klebsiella aerogenes]HDT2980881.1 hypothetical protein [Klebsiella aerogenes]
MKADTLGKKCVCEGRNPQCAFCGGWGYLDSIGEARSSSGPLSPPIKKSKTKRKKQSSLPISTPPKPKVQKVKPKMNIEPRCVLCGKVVEDFSSHNCVTPNRESLWKKLSEL